METPKVADLISTELLRLPPAGLRSIAEYASLHPLPSGVSEMDEVLEGGFESGNFYLFLGPAKSGKSSFLRSLALALAPKVPVLYVNFEQLGRSSFATIYAKLYDEPFRRAIARDMSSVAENVEKMPDFPFYIAFWTDALVSKAFDGSVKGLLQKSIAEIATETGQTPVVVMENLSDIYNERLGGKDSLTNVVSQTAQDIKNFCISNAATVLLAHHTGKLSGEKPTLDDARDSKRVVDLAHSIFCSSREEDDFGTSSYRFSYLGGRGMGGTRYWNINYGLAGKIQLTNYVPIKKETKKRT